MLEDTGKILVLPVLCNTGRFWKNTSNTSIADTGRFWKILVIPEPVLQILED
jgi:hypothetical protein